MRVYQAKRIAVQHVHVRINGESCISTELMGTNAPSFMIVPFTQARKARRIQVMRGRVDMQMM